MNSLSWMIYAADIVGNLSGFLMALAVIAFALAALSGCFLAATFSTYSKEDDEYKKASAVSTAVLGKWWLAVVLALLYVVTPSSNTIYMIAASEAGETIVTSPEAREVFNDLKTIIKSKLKEQLPKS